MRSHILDIGFGSTLSKTVEDLTPQVAIEGVTDTLVTNKNVMSMDSAQFRAQMKHRALSAYMDAAPAPVSVAPNSSSASNKDSVLVKSDGEYFLTINPMTVTDLDHTNPTRLKVWFHQSVNEGDVIHLSLAPPFPYFRVPPSFFSTILNQIYVSAGKMIGHVDRGYVGVEAYFMFACKEMVVGEYGSLMLAPLSDKLPEDRCQMERAESAFGLELLNQAVRRGWVTEEERDLLDSGEMVFLTANDLRGRVTEDNGLSVGG